MAELLDQQVADQIVAQFSTGQAARNKTAIASSIASRRLTPYTACDAIGKGVNQPVKNYIGKGTGQAAKTLAAIPDPTLITKAAAVVLMAFTAVLGVFTKHHAKAVANEQAGLCGTVPELQAALDQADSLFTSGATPASLISDLRATSGEFKRTTAGLFKECNATCFYQREFDAQIDVRAKVDYQRGAGGKVIAFIKRNKLAVGLTTGVAVVALVVAKTL